MAIWATRDIDGDCITLWPFGPQVDWDGHFEAPDKDPDLPHPVRICNQFFRRMVVGLELKPGECKRLDGKFHYKEEGK